MLYDTLKMWASSAKKKKKKKGNRIDVNYPTQGSSIYICVCLGIVYLGFLLKKIYESGLQYILYLEKIWKNEKNGETKMKF